MPKSYTINPVGPLVVAAIAVIGIVLIGYKLLQTERHVEAIKIELERTSARASELEEHAAHLSSERESAISQRIDVQEKLDEANRAIGVLQSKLDQSTSTIEDLRKQTEQVQSEFDHKQSRLEDLQSEVESLKQTSDKENAKAKNANTERDELQAELDQANSEIDRLKGELKQAKEVPAPASQL